MSNLIGQKFGDLTIISLSHYDPKTRYNWWNCLCICGNKKKIPTASLRRKKRPTVSCGCYRIKRTKETGAVNKLPKSYASFNILFYTYKKTAKIRDYGFHLTKDQFKVLTSNNCHYCNKEPAQRISGKQVNGDYLYNGVDRLDSNLGYTPENCVTCCKACNYAKRQMTYNEFKEWIIRLYDHLKLGY